MELAWHLLVILIANMIEKYLDWGAFLEALCLFGFYNEMYGEMKPYANPTSPMKRER